MESLDKLTTEQAVRISLVLTDIDDTLTTDGKLVPEAYSALWDLYNAGVGVIPVTGRPAGWCDLIARFWPVDAVIGENGAFAFYQEDRRMKRLYHPAVDRDAASEGLEELRKTLLSAIPGSRIAEDQFSRLFDLAIDYREQPPFLGLDEAEAIRKVCEDAGAHAKTSSIHVNAWFGDYDKLSMARYFLARHYPHYDITGDVFFVGDSPNDEPMFSFFSMSCGVANIRPFLPVMTAHPSYITTQEGGRGFAEVAARILDLRQG